MNGTLSELSTISGRLGLEVVDVRPGAARIDIDPRSAIKEESGAIKRAVLLAAVRAAASEAVNGAAGHAIDADASTATISGVRYLKAAHGVVSAEAKVIGYLGSIQRELERSSASLVVRAAVTLTDGVDREVGEFMVEMRLQPRRVARIAA